MDFRPIYAIFVLSGFSGLLYQVIWVRTFGNIFGNTIYSSSLVIAVFMAGLGVGSCAAGWWIDRNYRRSPSFALKAYAYSELLIGGLAVINLLLLPRLEPLSAHISAYTQDARGWWTLTAGSYFFRYALAVLLLAPITTLMGGTLTLLIRHLLHADLRASGWRIGMLYGFNTAGAAAGAFLSDFALIPNLGLRATQMVAILFNFLAAFAALRLVRTPAKTLAAEEVAPPADESRAAVASGPVLFTGAAIFFSGFSAMGVEILWFRHLSIGLGSYRSVFSVLLTVILVGIWLGSIAGGWRQRKWGRPDLLYVLSQTIFVAATILLLGAVRFGQGIDWANALVSFLPIGKNLLPTWILLKPIVLLVAIPALLMGFAYPLANANIQKAAGSVGRRAGFLYLANTVGAVLGSLCAGFVLLPQLALKGSMTVLAGVSAASMLCLYFAAPRTAGERGPRWPRRAVFAGCLAAVGLCVLWWSRMPPARFQNIGLAANHKVLAISEGVYELIAITESGPPDPGRRLITNGHPMSATVKMAQRYMRAFSHIPLMNLENPRSVLVICFGVGTTLHAASLHPSVTRLDVADLSRHVLEQAPYFAESNRNVLADPRVHVFVNDGRQHLWMQPEKTYDLITLEPPPIKFAGVASLYSKEFYELCRSRLRSGGFMSQWLPGYQVRDDVVRSMVRAFVDVFPGAALLSGETDELILVGVKGAPFTLDIDRVRTTLARNAAVRADLEKIDLGTPLEIAGMFLAGGTALRAATRGVRPMSDDLPVMEYSGNSYLCRPNAFPEELVDPIAIRDWCPVCFPNGQPAPDLALLNDYIDIFDAYYHSESFLHPNSCGPDTSPIHVPIRSGSDVLQKSAYLREMFRLR
jgi:predicted membrane-bound spermidine synthase